MIMIGCKAFGIDQTDRIYYIVFFFSCIFFVFSIFKYKWEKKSLLTIMLTLIPFIISCLCGKNITPLVFAITIIGSIGIDKDKSMKIFCKEWIVFFMVNVSLSLLGIKSMQPNYLYNDSGVIGIAYGLGFGNKNQLAIACAVVLCAYIYLRFEKNKIIELIIVDIILYSILIYAQSTTGFVIMFFINISYFFFKIKILSKYTEGLVRVMCPAVIIFSFVASALYPFFAVLEVLNSILTTRIWLGYRALSIVPISLFGKQITDFTIDNMYLSTYVKSGLIVFIIVFALYCKTQKILYRKNMKKELIIFSSMILVGVCEGAVLNPFINIFLIFVGYVLDDCFIKEVSCEQVYTSNEKIL